MSFDYMHFACFGCFAWLHTFCLLRFFASSKSPYLGLPLDEQPKEGSTTTDREPTDSKQTDREQRRLAEKGDPKPIFTIPRANLPKPSLSDEITATKSVTKLCNEIIASRSVDLAG